MRTTDKWTDAIGQEYRPGDIVAVAVGTGSSAAQVVAKVLAINTHFANGEPITHYLWDVVNKCNVIAPTVTVTLKKLGKWDNMYGTAISTFRTPSNIILLKGLTEQDIP